MRTSFDAFDTDELKTLRDALAATRGLPASDIEKRLFHEAEVELDRRARFDARIAEMEAEVRRLRAFKARVDEALNSGSGVYKP